MKNRGYEELTLKELNQLAKAARYRKQNTGNAIEDCSLCHTYPHNCRECPADRVGNRDDSVCNQYSKIIFDDEAKKYAALIVTEVNLEKKRRKDDKVKED